MGKKKYLRYASAIIVLAISLALYGCGAPAGTPEDGKRWYTMHNCSSCHGLHGNDGRAVDIAGIDIMFSSFVRTLRRTDAPIMPHFSESKISKQDAADMYAYLKSVKNTQ